MTFVKHELKQGKVSFLIWTISIGFLLAVCVFLFPEMKGQMDGISETFASMGSFTAAFGMDRLDFGTLIGFYAAMYWGLAVRFMQRFALSIFSARRKRIKQRSFYLLILSDGQRLSPKS